MRWWPFGRDQPPAPPPGAKEDVYDLMFSEELPTHELPPAWTEEAEAAPDRGATPVISERMARRLARPEEAPPKVDPQLSVADLPSRIGHHLLAPWRALPEWARIVVAGVALTAPLLLLLAPAVRQPILSWIQATLGR